MLLFLFLLSSAIPLYLQFFSFIFLSCNHLKTLFFSPIGHASEMENGLKKADPQRNPRYIDIRMDEVFPAKKPRFKLASGKENAKVTSPENAYDGNILMQLKFLLVIS